MAATQALLDEMTHKEDEAWGYYDANDMSLEDYDRVRDYCARAHEAILDDYDYGRDNADEAIATAIRQIDLLLEP